METYTEYRIKSAKQNVRTWLNELKKLYDTLPIGDVRGSAKQITEIKKILREML